MKIYKTISSLQEEIKSLKSKNLTVGFVPTMGALHKGHISLISYSVSECDITVASIFVNPTQFNNKSDFNNYPITLDSDTEKLQTAGCNILFLPDVKEMYPEPDNRTFEFDGIDTVMEGRFRPGHFNGVAQIVSKLFDAVNPDKSYFGKKDFQQLAIIKKIVEKSNYNIDIVGCPIVREDDGLAMSSRNLRLSEEERVKSIDISKTLFELNEKKETMSISQIKSWVELNFSHDKTYKFEYFDIVDSTSLKSVSQWDTPNEKIACIAVFVGNIRLIDNIFI